MTPATHLFKELLKRKIQRVNIIVTIQFVSAIALAFFTNFSINLGMIHTRLTNPADFLTEILACFGSLFFVFGLILFLLTISQNERLNRDQTWRIIPITDGKFYIENIFSSFISLIYFVLVNVIIVFILLLICVLFNSKFRQNLGINIHPSLEFFYVIIVAILSCFFMFLIASFLNFSSIAISDFLPQGSNRTILFLVRLLIIIVIIGFIWKINSVFSFYDFFTGNFNLVNLKVTSLNSLVELENLMIVLFVIDLVILALNLFLINHFFEPEKK